MVNRRVHVKICGMTRCNDVRAAVSLGVDAIGMIMYANSPRIVDLDQAKRIRDEVPAFVSLVGVFVNCPARKTDQIASEAGLDLIQLHGAESNEFGVSLSRPFIKAIRAQSANQVGREITQYPNARALLIDPYVKGQHGGTGQCLDQMLWPASDQKQVLAGGLSADNVNGMVQEFKPFAVDLNSGVESSPGHKDISLIEKALVALGR